MLGQTLAHYKILEKIGQGGMGEVYLTQDAKLDRKVALKVLPPQLAASGDRRARFECEAKAIAALDHPNIVQVFAVEEAQGIHFFTMQLVRGKTLTELIPNNGFVLNKFFEVAIPLADAVAAAHQEGITHRDLKPDNVMVSEEGRIKVLDFGLAKPTPGFATEGSELETQAKTAEGTIVGTLNYMSPEQTQGKTVDARSDIFSLGIIFYEMLTGRRPFTGETPAEVLSSINKDAPPPVTESRPQIPRALSRITTHPANDYTPLWSPDGRWLVFLSRRTGGRRLWRVSVEGEEPELLTETPARNPIRLSPDGNVVYFRRGDNSDVWALSLEDGTEYQVTDLGGRRGSRAHGLATDGRYLYFNWSDNLGDIWVMDVVTDESK